MQFERIVKGEAKFDVFREENQRKFKIIEVTNQ
jgi:hypothetical protein